MKLELKNSLSVKLLRVVLLSALIVGVTLSVAQIVFDAYKTRQAVAGDAQRILDMFRDPSTQAVYSLDREMGMQVIEGLFQDEAVRMASIGHPNETMLAEKSRALQHSPSRWLTDLILGRERTFTTALVGKGPYSEYYGDLSITLDTATYGQGFIVSSVIIFISGVLRALAMGLVLYLVYHWLLTKPLSRIIEHLTSINPDRPSEHKIPQLKGHERNELGLWINTANQLLESIERNTHLRHEAESSLLRMAQYDFLTGLPNRQKLQEQLDKILIDAGRRQRRVAVLCVGLDDFKSVNEQFTYQAGDKLLLALADRLRAHSGRLGALARLGGDQFALVQADIDQPYEAAELAQSILDDLEAEFALDHEEIRLRAAMMASVDEGMADVFKALEETGELDNTFILFLGDNGYFFGEHGLGPERRFAYEEGIRSPFLIRYPAWFKPGTLNDDLVLALDIAPTVLDLAGAKAADKEHIQGLSLRPLSKNGSKRGWRRSFMCEYFSENAMPWLIGMSYKAIRTTTHKYIHWTQKSLDGVECDELYDLQADPFEMKNLIGRRGAAPLVARLRKQLAQLVSHSVGL